MIDLIKHFLSDYLIIPTIFVLGAYLSFKLRFIQIAKFSRGFKLFLLERDPTGKPSSFSAVSAVLGGNLGTGNIAGIAVALKAGGPGALFWMWVMALLGAAIKFTGCTLGVLYRQKNPNGGYIGGPMYYLEKGLNLPFLAKLFALATICGAMTVGNWVQMHSVALPLSDSGIHPLTSGVAMSLLVGLVVFGGLKRFNKVVSLIVPFMALGYISICLFILFSNLEKILPSFSLIFTAALNPTTVVGGVLGFTVLEAMRTGFDRGIFATDVGVGLAPIIHSAVDNPEMSIRQVALTQGLISTIPPIIVMIVCMLTGLVLMVTGAWQLPDVESTNMCIAAFKSGLGNQLAAPTITIILMFFAYTTILTWSFCADRAIEYLFSKKWVPYFQFLFTIFIPLGTLFTVNMIWSLADIFMNCMLLINVIGIIGLCKLVFKEVNLNEYPFKSLQMPLKKYTV
jgi:alanine or glycine:cation symporter, AGCS family